jgi:hypothetical protein
MLVKLKRGGGEARNSQQQAEQTWPDCSLTCWRRTHAALLVGRPFYGAMLMIRRHRFAWREREIVLPEGEREQQMRTVEGIRV